MPINHFDRKAFTMQATQTVPYFAITHEWQEDTDRMAKLAQPVEGPSHTPDTGNIATIRFRLLDDDRNIMCMGMCNHESADGEYNPLYCYGEGMFGCTIMQVWHAGEGWRDYLG